MRSYEIQQECLATAQNLAMTAEGMGGGPYECDVIAGQNRAHARASTERSWKAFMRENRNHYLSHSIPGGRGKRRGRR
jgi:hypothetical protein